MKKIFTKIVMVLIVVLIGIGFKSYKLFSYSFEKKNIRVEKETTINMKETKQNIHIEKINLYLDPLVYTYYSKEDKYVKILNSKYKIDFDIVNNVIKNTCVEDKKLGSTDYIDAMKTKNISNELELINYYIKNTNTNGVFSSINKMKLDYLANSFINKIGISNSISYIDGLDGIIFKDDNTNVVIFDNGNMYKIVFSKEFKETEIKEIISTISIK